MEFAGDRGGATGRANFPAAPFVSKTYKIVSDPANAAIISWGKNNNSFIVFDPFAFSQSLLPAHFKHSNFSSFVRQLNTYGFRKIDPDRWEFAHVSFLRDRTELLWQIERRRKKRDGEMDGGDEAVAMEVVGLKKEQMAIDDRLERLWARVRETEIRRRQMIGFLAKVFEAPLGLLTARNEIGEEEGIEWEKKVRRRIDAFPVDNGF